ncbi:MAG: aldehyde dehydrogenase EutE [Verrucomicrobia bacterium]|nr:aldehyde dehydrogenase EutE [Verrucomicrobiota bacterium]
MNNPSINETLIREVVEDVLGRLGKPSAAPAPQPAPPPRSPAAPPAPPAVSRPSAAPSGGRRLGVFSDATEACSAAAEAFEKLSAQGMAGRARVIEIVKTLSSAHAAEWGRIELEETKIGRLDHKIEKLLGLKAVPGIESLCPDGFSGDHGITLEEFAPFGVIGAITPSTHSIPTLSCNVINMVAAGNAVVFNAHPGAYRCAAMAARVYNEAIFRELGIENLIAIVDPPTLESFKAICASDQVRLLCVTGGPGVVKAAMQAGKRAICAGPGNPPVLVDDTADIDRAARCIIQGAAYDNNLLCIGEKEVFVLESVAGRLMEALQRQGAARLDSAQIDRLKREAFVFPAGQGAGCPHATVNKELIGKDAALLARVAGANVPAGTELLWGETGADHLFVQEEQMMPFVPVVRVPTVSAGIEAARAAEHGYRHTAIIHSHNVSHMTAMAKALNTTLFIKNGSCLAGLGNGGEGYPSFSIATPTGEGVTSPKTFTRVRRCVMVDNLRIF